MMTGEGFRPVSNTPPDSFLGKLKFYGRMLVDFQIYTIYKDIRKVVPQLQGSVLDVGCGQSPYKYLLPEKTQYSGIDIVDASKFDYRNSDITPFNGEDIPFEDEKFDGVICTEVLEHVIKYQRLIDEMHRVMKRGAKAIITVPWSARYHYIPYDYFRYTPSALREMFARFSEVDITNRGTDIQVIANKTIVLWFRNLTPTSPWKWILVPVWVLLSPIPVAVTIAAHMSLWFGFGSDSDPLGYTITLKK